MNSFGAGSSAHREQIIDREEQEGFWKSHYDALATRGVAWLDYGNERVQRQSLALALECAEPVAGMRCADIGCGRGQLGRSLRERGAADVIGADASEALVSALEREHPGIQWISYSLLQMPLDVFPGTYDRVFAVEVLQYVPLSLAMDHLWQLTAPGGRLVGIVPNRDCQFLAGAIARFEGHYAPPNPAELGAAIGGLGGVGHVGLSGMWYTQLTEGPPYRVSPISSEASPPNRLLFTIDKQSLSR
jgi:2-polyprenyl-3-methyl-5-hydroxy-6-metoxy-1,4-benzoquinol methylase